MPFLNSEIVQTLVMDMINRQYVDFGSRRLVDFGQKWSDRERFVYGHFEKQYLAKAKVSASEKQES